MLKSSTAVGILSSSPYTINTSLSYFQATLLDQLKHGIVIILANLKFLLEVILLLPNNVLFFFFYLNVDFV